MDLDSLQEIMRTGRLESATAARTADKTQERRESQLVDADQCAQKGFHRLFEKESSPQSQRPPLRLKLAKSGRAGAVPPDQHKPKSRFDPRQVNPHKLTQPATQSIPIHCPAHFPRGDKSHPRIRSNRGECRTQDHPATVMGIPVLPEPLKLSGSRQTSRLGELQVDHALSAIGLSKNPARNERSEGRHSSLSVARVMNLDAFRQETFAPLSPAPRENRAAVFGFHASTESELAFAGALGGLIRTFHKP